MFARTLRIERVDSHGTRYPCPLRWIDNFAMRNFTNDALFDDTLPIAEGWLEIGNRVPVDKLREAMQDWFRRKAYLAENEHLNLTELSVGDLERANAPTPPLPAR